MKAKEEAREAGWARIKHALGDIGDRLPRNIDRFEDKIDWLGVVHADGNGFGQLFLNFDKYAAATTARGYFAAYRQFSLSLELCGIDAFKAALTKLAGQIDKKAAAAASAQADDSQADEYKRKNRKYDLHVVPLILGGDDLTVVCDGRYAIDFAADYLQAFEAATENPIFGDFESSIPLIAEKAGVKLGAAAGVAIVKPHFPFHRAYQLAEKLGASAKSTKRLLATEKDGKRRLCFAISALDFQAIYEDAAADHALLRKHWEQDGETTRLYTRPYLVSGKPRIDAVVRDLGDQARTWVRNRSFDEFRNSVEALRRGEQSGEQAGAERVGLPRSQQHALREALFRGRRTAEARLDLIKHRYAGVAWDAIARGGDFFFADHTQDREAARDPGQHIKWKDVRSTVYLDALEYIDIARPAGDRPERAEAGEPPEEESEATPVSEDEPA